jgi:hypothetical protein
MVGSSTGPNNVSWSESTGCDPNGENSLRIVGTGLAKVVVAGSSLNDSIEDRYTDNGMRFKSSPPLTSTGALISNSLVFDPLRFLDADRFDANLSLRTLKSGKMGVDGIWGDADALRAWRTTCGDKKPSVDGYVADLGVHGEGRGMVYESCPAPILGEGRGLRGAGGTGVRYLSLGFSVKAAEVSEMLRLCPSLGTSSTLRRCPGRRGQKVVDSSEGSWHSSSSSTLYCALSLREPY